MSDEKITCQLCTAKIHVVKAHLDANHKDVTLEEYQRRFPHAPTLSPLAEREVQKHIAAKGGTSAVSAAAPSPDPATVSAVTSLQSVVTAGPGGKVKAPFHEVFKIGAVKAAMNARGEPILISKMGPHDRQDMVPLEDIAYIFNIDLLKTLMMGVELGFPVYTWGHAGTGKTTMFEQLFHHLNWPTLRVQHTLNTEESHIVGQMLANEKGTYFEPGPLPVCMRYGLAYLADEYDRALPGVLSVYQPVLEGKPLVIKEAPPEWRVVMPHPNFRFVATGNSNGSGDESGLYQSTMLQDASNYSRFAICEKVDYMPAQQERRILEAKAGITKEDAERLVNFAAQVRKEFEAKTLTNPIGPRELLFAAILGARRNDFIAGIKLAFANKLPTRSKLAVESYAQRIFG